MIISGRYTLLKQHEKMKKELLHRNLLASTGSLEIDLGKRLKSLTLLDPRCLQIKAHY